MLCVPSSLTLNQCDADHMIYSLPHVYHCYCHIGNLSHWKSYVWYP